MTQPETTIAPPPPPAQHAEQSLAALIEVFAEYLARTCAKDAPTIEIPPRRPQPKR